MLRWGRVCLGGCGKMCCCKVGSARSGVVWWGGHGPLWFVMGGKFRNGQAGSVMARRFRYVGSRYVAVGYGMAKYGGQGMSMFGMFGCVAVCQGGRGN